MSKMIAKNEKGIARANAAFDRNKMRQMVVDTIIKQIERGSTKWLKPFAGGESSLPRSISSGRNYRGINVWWLWAKASESGWSNEWGTFNAWRKRGASLAERTGSDEYFGVERGSEGTPVFFWKILTITERDRDGDEIEKRIPLLKWFTVFNRDQTNLPAPEVPEDNNEVTDPEAATLAIYEDNEITLKHGGNRAFYSPSRDFVSVPKRTYFHSSESYLSTLLHEAVHWTGHGSRLNRQIENTWGGDDYAFEELIAEMGAAMLTVEVGIEYDHLTIDNHAAYLGNWLQGLKSDGGAQALWRAASAAQKAADLLLGYEPEQEASE